MTTIPPIRLTNRDALVVVDVQQDFLPGGALGVPGGDDIVPVLNNYIALFQQRDLLIVATRDWHPANHCSFKPQGGPWPVHCVAESSGAAFARGLNLPASAIIVSKATTTDMDAYSAFSGTDLAGQLTARGIERVFVGGLATDYCVVCSVKDALQHAFDVVLLVDAIRAVNVQPGDGARALQEMLRAGATTAVLAQVAGQVSRGLSGTSG